MDCNHTHNKKTHAQVDGYDVLQEDNYTMAEGGISVTARGHNKNVYVRKRRQQAGEDYQHNDYCQVCSICCLIGRHAVCSHVLFVSSS